MVGVRRRLVATLREPGVYTKFTYDWTRWAPPGRRQHAALRAVFEEVVAGRTVWRNAPPAFVYSARRPRVPATVVEEVAA